MGLFLGIIFHPHYLQFKKLESFRRRFDSKYYKCRHLQMTLFPPFSVNRQDDVFDLIEELEEDLDSQLYELDGIGQVRFERIDFNIGRKGILYLKPKLAIDFHHTLDVLYETLTRARVRFKNNWKMKGKRHWGSETFLPLGRFGAGECEVEAMQAAYESARLEFALPLELQASHVCLFENLTDQWVIKRKLFTFSHDEATLNLDDIRFQKPSEVYQTKQS